MMKENDGEKYASGLLGNPKRQCRSSLPKFQRDDGEPELQKLDGDPGNGVSNSN